MSNMNHVFHEKLSFNKEIYTIIRNDKQLENASYVIVDNKEIVIIDPATNTSKILQIINENAFIVVGIILTHGHWDHWLSAKVLCEKYQCKMLVHPAEQFNLTNGKKRALQFGYEVEDFILDHIQYVEFKNNQIFKLKNFEFEIIVTPGHSPGSICLKWEQFVFSGDLVFLDSIGRTDLEGSSPNDMIKSLQFFLQKYQDELTILPGHGQGEKLKNIRPIILEILDKKIF